MKKLLIALVCILLVVGVVGGTLAWLTAETAPVVNTFSPSTISIELDETTGEDYKMIPGCTIEKDPVVTVEGGSEACWLFVEIDETTNFDDFMTYDVAEGWELVEGETNVYCRKVAASDEDQEFQVIEADTVTVKTTVTEEMMEALTEAPYPKLTFTAYATQLMKANDTEFTAAQAWAEIGA